MNWPPTRQASVPLTPPGSATSRSRPQLATKSILGLDSVNDDRLRMEISNRLGVLCYYYLDYDRAVEQFEFSLAAAERIGDGQKLCRELYNIAEALLLRVPATPNIRPCDRNRTARARRGNGTETNRRGKGFEQPSAGQLSTARRGPVRISGPLGDALQVLAESQAPRTRAHLRNRTRSSHGSTPDVPQAADRGQ